MMAISLGRFLYIVELYGSDKRRSRDMPIPRFTATTRPSRTFQKLALFRASEN